MSIRARLYLLVLAVLSGVVVVQLTVLRSTRSMEKQLGRLEFANGLAARTTEVAILTDLFLNYGELRYGQAWRSNFQRLKEEMLRREMVTWPNGVRHAVHSIEAAFLLTDEARTVPASFPDPVLRARLLDRAAIRILADVQLLMAATQREVQLAADAIRKDQEQQRRDLLYAGLALLLFAAALVLWVNRAFMNSLKVLMAGTARIAEGDLEVRVRVPGSDEHAELAKRFNRMAGKLYDMLSTERTLRNDLQRSTAELARSNGDLEQFASLASHDLKEPLRMINSFMQLLQRNYGDELDDKARTYIHFAVDGSARMARLIDALLEYARLGRTSHVMAPVDLGQLMDEVRGFVDAELVATKGDLTWDRLPTVIGAALPLRLVLQNLVANALKYHRADIPPRIHVSTGEDGAHWTIAVRDNGMGIPEQDAAHVFLPFKRLSGGRKLQGTGMGLALCARIADLHKGTIRVGPAEGGGCIFSFSISKSLVPGVDVQTLAPKDERS